MLKDIIKIKKRFFILLALISVFLGISLNAFASSDFNSAPGDTPLEGLNFTQDRSSVWKSSLTNVNPGDQLKFNVYYHNASDSVANNTQVELSLGGTPSTSFTALSKITANGFNDYSSSMGISLTSKQNITIRNLAKLYHSHDGTKFKEDVLNVTITGNKAVVDLGQVSPGYAPHDGYVVFYADVGQDQISSKSFNSAPGDTPLEGLNFTQDRSSVWKSSLTNVNPGDQLKFNVYYHNASDSVANNTQVELSLGGTPSTSFTALSKITANGFNDYSSSMGISLTSKQNITIRNLAKLYHSHDGTKFKEDVLNVTITGNKAVVDLGQVSPGYAPHDGYVVFYADVGQDQISSKSFNSAPGDTPLEGLNFTQDRSSVWKSSLTNVNPGDQLKFNVYYHNASDSVANNTQVELSLGGTPSTSFTALSKITANGFNDYSSSMGISLTSKQNITIRNLAKLYHSHDGTKFKEDVLNVTITGNKAVVDLGQVSPGYAPHDGYVVFYADVGQDQISSKSFNSAPGDTPLEGLNFTQDRSSVWKSSLTNVNPGDQLKFNVYYHNASDSVANNTQVELSLGGTPSTSFTALSKITANGFNDYSSSMGISLTSKQNITIRNLAKLYHSHDGTKFKEDVLNVTITGNKAVVDLGQVSPGYAPHDGYVVFYADVGQDQISSKSFNSAPGDTPLEGLNFTQDRSSVWKSSLTNVNPGDQLKFNVYYHNASDSVANNTQVELSLGGTPSTSFTALSKITANGFNDYSSSMGISLTSKQNITIRNLAKLYHSHDGTKFKEDVLNVTITGNKAVVDLGQVSPGYAPHDGYVVFYADVGQDQISSKSFNSAPGDTPLEGLNFTQDRSSVWKSSLTNVNPGDQLKFNVYYHNASDSVANNTQVELSLGGTPSTSFTALSKITANGFNDYSSSMGISLTSKQNITIRNLAKLYHSHDGTKFKEDVLNVTITGNKAVVDLGQVSPGYAPHDGYVVFYADVGQDQISSKSFNSAPGDTPLEGLNFTQDRSSVWKSSLTNVNPGDQLKFNVYYHNASDSVANNTQVELSLGGTPSTSFTALSKITANGFNDYSSSMGISLTSKQNITIRNLAKLYHSHDGTKFKEDVLNVTITGNKAVVDLGQVSPGYAPHDGYVVFYADVTKGTTPPDVGPKANAGADQTVAPNSKVQLDGSKSVGTKLTYAWTCNNSITLNNSSIVNPTFIVPKNATSGTVYTCTLTVTDTDTKTSSDTVQITVKKSESTSTGGGGGSSIIYYGGNIEVELLDVSENSNGSVKLNGKITTCEKDNCEAKFLWGESKENLLNSTETIKNLKEGDLFSFTLRNLKKGKPYYVQVEAKLETKTVKDSKIIKFITRPDRPALLKATLLKDNSVQINFEKGEGGTIVFVKRGVDTCPTFNDQKAPTIYLGGETSFIDDATSANTSYCYRAWMVASDGTDLIFSDSIDSLISTKEIEKEDKKEEDKKPEKDNDIVITPDKPTHTINYELSLKSFVRNTSKDELDWKKITEAKPNEIVEFYIELENKGNASIEDILILNTIKNGIKEFKNVSINNVICSEEALERIFIEELKPHQTVKIRFFGVIDEQIKDKEIVLLTDAFSNKTKSLGESVKVIKLKNGDNAKASLIKAKEQCKSWLILVLVIIILSLIYIILRKKENSNKTI